MGRMRPGPKQGTRNWIHILMGWAGALLVPSPLSPRVWIKMWSILGLRNILFIYSDFQGTTTKKQRQVEKGRVLLPTALFLKWSAHYKSWSQEFLLGLLLGCQRNKRLGHPPLNQKWSSLISNWLSDPSFTSANNPPYLQVKMWVPCLLFHFWDFNFHVNMILMFCKYILTFMDRQSKKNLYV